MTGRKERSVSQKGWNGFSLDSHQSFGNKKKKKKEASRKEGGGGKERKGKERSRGDEDDKKSEENKPGRADRCVASVMDQYRTNSF